PYHDMTYLQFDGPFGMIMRNMHRWGAHAMVIAVWIHMLRVFMTGSYKPPREFNWIVGVNLLVFTLLLSFTGYLLPWDQLSIWAVTVGTNMARATPFLGHEGPFGELLGMNAHQAGEKDQGARAPQPHSHLAVSGPARVSRRPDRPHHHDDLVDHDRCAARRAGESQSNAESVEGALVLPRAAGNAGVLRSMDGR